MRLKSKLFLGLLGSTFTILPVLSVIACSVNENSIFEVDVLGNTADSYSVYYIDPANGQALAGGGPATIWDTKSNNLGELQKLEINGSYQQNIVVKLDNNSPLNSGFQKFIYALVYGSKEYHGDKQLPILDFKTYKLMPLFNDDGKLPTLGVFVDKVAYEVKKVTDPIAKVLKFMEIMNQYYVAWDPTQDASLPVHSVEYSFAEAQIFIPPQGGGGNNQGALIPVPFAGNPVTTEGNFETFQYKPNGETEPLPPFKQKISIVLDEQAMNKNKDYFQYIEDTE